jgi:hypothetical protein
MRRYAFPAFVTIVLVVAAPLIFAQPSTERANYLPMVFNPPTPTPTPTTEPTATNTPTTTATPQPTATTRPTTQPTPTRNPPQCAPEYPTVCIPPPPPDLNCPDITYRNFTVLPPDRHHFDNDHDGIGCETP